MKFEDFYDEIDRRRRAKLIQELTRAGEHESSETYSGLSAVQFSNLVKKFDSENSVVRIAPYFSEDVLDTIPLFVLLEEYLKIAERDKGLGLTGLGYVKRKPLVELYEKKYIPVPEIEKGLWTLRGESEWPAAGMLHDITLFEGWLRKYRGKLVITKKGKDLLRGSRSGFFRVFLKWFLVNSWPKTDLYPENRAIEGLVPYTFYLLHKFGGEPRISGFYADRFLEAYPSAIREVDVSEFSTPEERFSTIYSLRTFERFLGWLGLVSIKNRSEKLLDSEQLIRTTPLFNKVFDIDETAGNDGSIMS
jgi:hypothetical protein